MKVTDLCRREVVTISAAATVVEAARLMCSQHVGAVIQLRSVLIGDA